MRPDPATEARLFGKLAVRGVVPAEAVSRLFAEVAAARAAGQPASLSAAAVRAGLIDKERLLRYFQTDGDEVPELPGYAWVAKLGEGGTASVYRVRRADGATEAVKMLHEPLAAQPEAVKSFLAEANLLKGLDHPNVVKGYRAGRFAGRYLFFLEDVDGATLQEKIAQGGAFDEDGALFVILQVARALEYLRSRGLVHRDIKPGNILVTADNQVKVIDLGFAAANAAAPAAGASDAPGAAPRAGAMTSGTAAFLSPEQAMGRSDLDVRSDIYSLGGTLYQMVLGELPFAGDDAELVQKAVLESLSAEATKGGRISAHMHYFIEKMMAKDRDIRYQSPAELMADIENQISGKKTAEAAPPDDSAADEAELQRRRLSRMIRKRRDR
ncbi:MAG TPA: serine/threonine-protein kinase [Planctomycetota bacterium]|nr:serine/threonine-protein kinase [Planctomycetota bacterium]